MTNISRTPHKLRSPAQALLLLWMAAACGKETLTTQRPRLFITPQPDSGQLAIDRPAGLDLGEVPVFGVERATFQLRNAGTNNLQISEIKAVEEANGTFVVVDFPSKLAPAEEGDLVIDFSPASDGLVGEGTFEIVSNDDVSDNTVVVRGTGLFVGDPVLEVCYDGNCYPLPDDCTDGVCDLPLLDFGNVALSSTGSAQLRIRNTPPDGTCQAPPDSPACTKVCQLIFAKNPDGADIGFGYEGDTPFALAGSVATPFAIDVPEAGCDTNDEARVLLTYAASDVETTENDVLIMETNDPLARTVRIPVRATVREAPVAIAELKACVGGDPTPCSTEGTIGPLTRAYVTGENSFDPDGLALSAYRWEVIEFPEGADPAQIDLQGANSVDASIFLPIAGVYRLRLEVENEDGVVSGVTAASDVQISAIPASRVSIELTWSNANNDMDLHVALAEDGHKVCRRTEDCFWASCRSGCDVDEDCTVTHWFNDVAPLQGPNPRLDVDDEEGLGPENVNIDEPREGRYRVYAHYYGLVAPESAPTQNRVRILIDGIVAGQFSRRLNRNELWRVADIVWDAEGNGAVELTESDGSGVGAVQVMNQCPPEGVSFGSIN